MRGRGGCAPVARQWARPQSARQGAGGRGEAGHVTWLGEVVGQLERNQVVHGITRTVQLPDGSRTVEARAAVNVWVKLYQEERDRLVRVARAAIVAGAAERQVRLADGQAQQLAQVIRAILTDLGHDLADEHVREVVRRRLTEGGNGDRQLPPGRP